MKITVTSLMGAMAAMATGQHTHYISLIAPSDHCPNMGQNHLILRFHDVETPDGIHIPPTLEDTKRIIAFAKTLPEDADLLVNCWAGISRSTAVAIGIACMGDKTPSEAFQHIKDIRQPQLSPGYYVLPNRRMIAFFDDELGLSGELNRVVDEYYGTLPLLGVTTLPNRGGWNTTA
jgi:predicted protein tyrosine phosphatase